SAEMILLDKLGSKLESISKVPTATACPQYYLSFASDLSEALNEMIGQYNSIALHHKLMSANRMERCILVGDYSNDERDPWRYYFVSHLNKSYVSEVHILNTMFQRITAM